MKKARKPRNAEVAVQATAAPPAARIVAPAVKQSLTTAAPAQAAASPLTTFIRLTRLTITGSADITGRVTLGGAP